MTGTFSTSSPATVLRQFEMHRVPGPLVHRDTEGPSRIVEGMAAALTKVWRVILVSVLHRCDDIDDLEAGLLGAHHRLLTGDEDHRHGAGGWAQKGRARSKKLSAPGTERREAEARLPGQPTMGRRHERPPPCSWRVRDQLDARGPQRLQQVEDFFFSRDAEDAVDALVFQRGDKTGRTLWACCNPCI